MVNFLAVSISLVFLCFTNSGYATKLPSFITACSRDDPNPHNCLLKESKKIYRKFLTVGVPEMGIGPMEPMKLGDFEINSPTLKILHKNSIIKGMKNIDLTDINIDFKKQTGEMRLQGNGTFKSNYEISGRLLLFTLTGKGPCKLKMYNLDLVMRWKWNLVERDGVKYMVVTEAGNTNKVDYAMVKLDGLFNNDKNLGNIMNEVLNNNWRYLYEEFGPPSLDIFQKKVIEVMNRLFSQIPYDDLHPRKTNN